MERGCCDWRQSDKPLTKVLVCGGIYYGERTKAFAAIDKILATRRVKLVVHGAAGLADDLAVAWAKSRGAECLGIPANWACHGEAADEARNGMLLATRPDLLLVLPGRGPEALIKSAKAWGLPIWRPYKPASLRP